MAAAQPGVEPDEPQQEPRFRFLQRLAAVPLVVRVVDQAYRCYCETKARSSLLARALSVVENAATVVVRWCKPVVRTSLGQQLEYADDVACQCLDKLQICYPGALRWPEEIIADVAAFREGKVAHLQRWARTKLDGVRDIYRAAAAGFAARIEAVKNRLRMARDWAHSLVTRFDHYLDWRLFLYSEHYPPHYNNLAAELTLSTRAHMVWQKMHTVAMLGLSHTVYNLLWEKGMFIKYLHSYPFGWNRFKAVMDPPLALAEQAYLLIAILVTSTALLIFDLTYIYIPGFYRVWVSVSEDDIHIPPDVPGFEHDLADVPVDDDPVVDFLVPENEIAGLLNDDL